MREPAHPVLKILAAGGAIPWRKRNRTPDSRAVRTCPRHQAQRATKIVVCRGHTATQPIIHHNRRNGSASSARHSAHTAMPANPVVRCNGDETRSCEAVTILILPVNGPPFGECHASQYLNPDSGSVADPFEKPGIRATPPVRSTRRGRRCRRLHGPGHASIASDALRAAGARRAAPHREVDRRRAEVRVSPAIGIAYDARASNASDCNTAPLGGRDKPRFIDDIGGDRLGAGRDSSHGGARYNRHHFSQDALGGRKNLLSECGLGQMRGSAQGQHGFEGTQQLPILLALTPGRKAHRLETIGELVIALDRMQSFRGANRHQTESATRCRASAASSTFDAAAPERRPRGYEPHR